MGRTPEFEPGERVRISVPKTYGELEPDLKLFFTGKTLILSPFPESVWKSVEGEIVDPEVKPQTLKERILFSRLVFGPQVRVKIEDKERVVSRRLVRKVSK